MKKVSIIMAILIMSIMANAQTSKKIMDLAEKSQNTTGYTSSPYSYFYMVDQSNYDRRISWPNLMYPIKLSIDSLWYSLDTTYSNLLDNINNISSGEGYWHLSMYDSSDATLTPYDTNSVYSKISIGYNWGTNYNPYSLYVSGETYISDKLTAYDGFKGSYYQFNNENKIWTRNDSMMFTLPFGTYSIYDFLNETSEETADNIEFDMNGYTFSVTDLSTSTPVALSISDLESTLSNITTNINGTSVNIDADNALKLNSDKIYITASDSIELNASNIFFTDGTDWTRYENGFFYNNEGDTIATRNWVMDNMGSGTGDMLKTTYDTDDNGIVDNSDITDAGGYYTSTTSEGALQEIGEKTQNITNTKIVIDTVAGDGSLRLVADTTDFTTNDYGWIQLNSTAAVMGWDEGGTITVTDGFIELESGGSGIKFKGGMMSYATIIDNVFNMPSGGDIQIGGNSIAGDTIPYYLQRVFNQTFNDTISFNRFQTSYADDTLTTDISLKYVYDSAFVGNTATINIIGSGDTIDFGIAKKIGATFDTTTNMLNYIVFGYNNTPIGADITYNIVSQIDISPFDPTDLEAFYYNDTNYAFTGTAGKSTYETFNNVFQVGTHSWDIYICLDIDDGAPSTVETIFGNLSTDIFTVNCNTTGTMRIRIDDGPTNIINDISGILNDGAVSKFVLNIRNNSGTLQVYSSTNGTDITQQTVTTTDLTSLTAFANTVDMYLGGYDATNNLLNGNIYGVLIDTLLIGASDRLNLIEYMYDN